TAPSIPIWSGRLSSHSEPLRCPYVTSRKSKRSLDLRDDLRRFGGRPRLQRLRLDVPELPDFEKELHRDIVVWRFRQGHDVVSPHRVENLHLGTELVGQGSHGVRTLGRLLHVLDSLLRPISEGNVVRHLQSPRKTHHGASIESRGTRDHADIVRLEAGRERVA